MEPKKPACVEQLFGFHVILLRSYPFAAVLLFLCEVYDDRCYKIDYSFQLTMTTITKHTISGKLHGNSMISAGCTTSDRTLGLLESIARTFPTCLATTSRTIQFPCPLVENVCVCACVFACVCGCVCVCVCVRCFFKGLTRCSKLKYPVGISSSGFCEKGLIKHRACRHEQTLGKCNMSIT